MTNKKDIENLLDRMNERCSRVRTTPDDYDDLRTVKYLIADRDLLEGLTAKLDENINNAIG